jgi:hypothetical protein
MGTLLRLMVGVVVGALVAALEFQGVHEEGNQVN